MTSKYKYRGRKYNVVFPFGERTFFGKNKKEVIKEINKIYKPQFRKYKKITAGTKFYRED